MSNTIANVLKEGERFDPNKAHVHMGSPWPVAVSGWTELPACARMTGTDGRQWYRVLHKKGSREDTRFIIRDQTEEHGVLMSFLTGPVDIYECYALAPYLFPDCFEPMLPEGAYYEGVGELPLMAHSSHVWKRTLSLKEVDEWAEYVGGAVACHVPGADPETGWGHGW